VLDRRSPQNQRYQQIVLDTAIAKMLAKELNIDQAMKEITDGWEAIINELGRDRQLKAYRESLGIPTKCPERATHLECLWRSIAPGRRRSTPPRHRGESRLAQAAGRRHSGLRRTGGRGR